MRNCQSSYLSGLVHLNSKNRGYKKCRHGIVTFRHLISSTARPVASLISSKSIPSYGSGILILDARVLKKKQVVSGQTDC